MLVHDRLPKTSTTRGPSTTDTHGLPDVSRIAADRRAWPTAPHLIQELDGGVTDAALADPPVAEAGQVGRPSGRARRASSRRRSAGRQAEKTYSPTCCTEVVVGAAPRLPWETRGRSGTRTAGLSTRNPPNPGTCLDACSSCSSGGIVVRTRRLLSVTRRSGVPGGSERTKSCTSGASFVSARICVTRMADIPLRAASPARNRTSRVRSRRSNSTACSRNATTRGTRATQDFLGRPAAGSRSTKADRKFSHGTSLGRLGCRTPLPQGPSRGARRTRLGGVPGRAAFGSLTSRTAF